jgi:hypothetical protein
MSSSEVRLRYLTAQLHDLGSYALYQFIRQVTAASSGALDLLETYARLDPAITNAYGVESPAAWRIK